ncbi:Ldh family oxidoreductase [Tabrizicola sp.]|uniref:Ldh family oxidoreductase n=1 Tax=Tabrizicola sp. TaxID=2005166 RepID=UPI0035B2CD22
MSPTIRVTPAEIERAVGAALIAHGATEANAAPVASAIARAEAGGNRVCGLFYAPVFCEQMQLGKVDGRAVPSVERRDGAVLVDAASGFAHPAIDAGLPHLIRAARDLGIAAMAVRRSYNALALGRHVLPLADSGLIGLCLANAPASVAPPGARRPLFGTNPLAFAAPVAGGPPILIDQSLSAVTRTEMILRKNRGEAIPAGWAQDREGRPTTDPAIGLEGSLLPAGGQKGANLSLIVEILAAALTGARLSIEASGFSNSEGGPPHVGQFLLAIDPDCFAGHRVAAALADLATGFEQAGVRLPGRHRTEPGPVAVDAGLWARVLSLA